MVVAEVVLTARLAIPLLPVEVLTDAGMEQVAGEVGLEGVLVILQLR